MKKQSQKPPPKSDEFLRFREATRVLLTVPKKEVDKKKAAYPKKRLRTNGSKSKAA